MPSFQSAIFLYNLLPLSSLFRYTVGLFLSIFAYSKQIQYGGGLVQVISGIYNSSSAGIQTLDPSQSVRVTAPPQSPCTGVRSNCWNSAVPHLHDAFINGIVLQSLFFRLFSLPLNMPVHSAFSLQNRIHNSITVLSEILSKKLIPARTVRNTVHTLLAMSRQDQIRLSALDF